ncbi:acyl carrier protein [Blautia sp. AF25-12LB]|nr:acyl carrier protein [Blautia sp. AF25-12LB]
MLEKMREIIAEQLNCDGETIGLDTSFKDDLGADSLDLFELVMALEEEYGLEIPAEELSDVETVGDIIEYLKTKVWRINSTPFTLNRIRIVSVQNTQQSRTFTL